MKKVVISLLSVFLLFGCQSNSSVKDREGNEVAIPATVEKIISTVPSNTEVLVGLGLSDKIIAVDEYSKGIDGLSNDTQYLNFTTPNIESIIALKPDLVVASSINKISGDDPFKQLTQAGISVVYIPTSTSFDEIKKDIDFMGAITKTDSKAKAINADIDKRVQAIKDIASTIKEEDKVNVYFEISSSPSMYSPGGNTFINDMITTLGATNIFGKENDWVLVNNESLIKANPDVIVSNESFNTDVVEGIKKRAGYSSINAIKNNRVYVIDVNITSRCSQLAVNGLEQLAKEIYPEYYAK